MKAAQFQLPLEALDNRSPQITCKLTHFRSTIIIIIIKYLNRNIWFSITASLNKVLSIITMTKNNYKKKEAINFHCS